MKHRKILASLLMLGIIAVGSVYSMNKTPTSIPQSVDTDIKFPLDDED